MAAYKRNPFTPTFGMVPPHMAGRVRLLADMRRAFSEGPGNPNLVTLLVGARGCGKTALLSCIAAEAEQEGWIAVNTVAMAGMLEDILQQAGKAAAHLVDEGPGRKLSALGIGQLLNLEWVFAEKGAENWRSRIEALLEKLDACAAGLLITVDEVRLEEEELVQLVSTYQLLVREGYRVALVMAGLPSDVDDLIADRRVTFLRRARQHHIGRIGDAEITSAFRKTVEEAGGSIDGSALASAVQAVAGFAYMMQLVGYFMWEEAPEGKHIDIACAEHGIERAQEDFTRGVLDATYRDMSEGDRAFAKMLAVLGKPSLVRDVAQKLGKSSSYASTYKSRLLKQGVVEELPDERLVFAIPFLKEYIASCD